MEGQGGVFVGVSPVAQSSHGLSGTLYMESVFELELEDKVPNGWPELAFARLAIRSNSSIFEQGTKVTPQRQL